MTLDQVLAVAQSAILAYFLAINTLYLFFTILAFKELLTYRHRVWRGDLRFLLAKSFYWPISILVPAYNERETIVANVRSLLMLGYPEFEIIVINDGSRDDTMAVLRKAFTLFPLPPITRLVLRTRPILGTYRSLDHPNLIVLDKENGGKSDALNAGINAATYPLFCSIDADSLLEPDALLRVARAFVEDESIVAAGGIIRVLNGSVVEEGRVVQVRAPGKPMLLCQALEYVRGFVAGRTALARLNALLIISGAFGLFRKDAVVEAGGYRSDTVCEDMEIVVRLHRQSRERKTPSRVIFVPDPVCWTQAPADWKSLLRQRDRWQRGLIETLAMHFRMFANPRYGPVGFVAMPYYVLFEGLGPIIETAGYLLVAILWLTGQLNIIFAVLFFLFAVLYGIILSVTSLLFDDLLFRRYDRSRDLARMILASFLEYFGYRQILVAVRTFSFLRVSRRRGRWGRIVRERIPASQAAR